MISSSSQKELNSNEIATLIHQNSQPESLNIHIINGRKYTRLFAEAMECVRKNPSLLNLELSIYNLGEKNIKRLAFSLQENKSIRILKIAGDCNAKEFNHIAQAILNRNIKISLCFEPSYSDRIGGHGKPLANVLPLLDSLDFSNKSYTTQQDMNLLALELLSNTSLTTLEMGTCTFKLFPQNTYTLAAAVALNSTLTSLSLSCKYPIDINRFCRLLNLNSSLQHLNLSLIPPSSPLTKEAIRLICNYPALERLELSNNHFEDGAITELAHNLNGHTQLKLLNLDLSIFNPDESTTLCQSFRINSTLTAIYLMTRSLNNGSGNALAEAIEGTTTLKTISFSDLGLDDETKQRIQNAFTLNYSIINLIQLGVSMKKQHKRNDFLAVKLNAHNDKTKTTTLTARCIQTILSKNLATDSLPSNIQLLCKKLPSGDKSHFEISIPSRR